MRRNIPSLVICFAFIAFSFLGELFVWGSPSFDVIDMLDDATLRSDYNNARNSRRGYQGQRARASQRRRPAPRRNRGYVARSEMTQNMEAVGSFLYSIFIISFIAFAFYYNRKLAQQQQNGRNGQRG